MKNKTILLTGATGFLGSNLLRKFVDVGYKKIIILKRSFSNTSRIDDLLALENVLFYDCDVVDLEQVFEENKIDAIVHCATEYGRTFKSSYKVLETNLMLPIKLLDLSTEYKVNVFINTDSYFNKENSSYSFLRDYSLSKKSLLLWLKNYSRSIKVVNMRLEHIFGFNDNKDKFCKYIFDEIVLKNSKNIDLTYGDQKRDFIYIDDVVDAYVKALEFALQNNFRIRSFEVGTGNAVAIKDFVKYVVQKHGVEDKCSLNFGNLPYREDEIMCSVADTVELATINFKSRYSYKQGIDLMYEEYLRGIGNEKK